MLKPQRSQSFHLTAEDKGSCGRNDVPNTEDQHDFEEAYFYIVGQSALVFRVDSLSTL